MDQNAVSAPGLVSSLEAMIQASVTSLLDRRLCPTADTLDAQVQASVAEALDRRLGPAVGSLGNRVTSLVEQRLGNAISTLNYRVNTAVAAALEQRLGPAGNTLTAQITFLPAPSSALPSVPPAQAQDLSEVNGPKEMTLTCPAKRELAKVHSVGDGGSKEKEQPTQNHNTTESDAPKPTSPESGDETSALTATLKKSSKSTGKETDTTSSGTPGSAVYLPFANSASKSKAKASSTPTAQLNAMTEQSSSTANKTTPAKRKMTQREGTTKASRTGESESTSLEEENDNQKPTKKRPKVKLDPPGYTNGPAIKFRRVSPKLTACAKSRGYPRVVDLKSFTEASNKQNLTMADVVVTVLFNYDPLSLYAFMDMDEFPTFHFIRKESDRKARNFTIARRRESFGVVVKVSDLS